MDHDVHLLIVDDDERIRGLLRKFLVRNGYMVSAARDAAHARKLLSGLDFDLIVLDVMMPGEDGISLTRHIRSHSRVPVLLLTAKSETEDRIAGFEAGADDYLAKPFEPKELLLRITAILRRMPAVTGDRAQPHMLVFGGFRYDLDKGALWQGDTMVHLTATENQLMRIFASQPGLAINRATLVERLGRDDGQSQERAVDVQITRLRRKIETDPKQPRFLQTVRGEGYLLSVE
ncbi:MAG: response regulator [Paracoccaceae bacterium]